MKPACSPSTRASWSAEWSGSSRVWALREFRRAALSLAMAASHRGQGRLALYVRPIRPEDEPLIHEMLKHVTMHDLRLRFFAPMKEFSHEFIARLTQLDYARAMAFVAFDEATGKNWSGGLNPLDRSMRAANMRSWCGRTSRARARLGADADDHRICEIGRVESHLRRRPGRQHRDAGNVPQPPVSR